MSQTIRKLALSLLLATGLLLSLAPPFPYLSSMAATSVLGSHAAQKDEPPPRGRFRVTLLGFYVNRETWDDALERDGKRDEVFILAKSYLYASGGKLLANSDLMRTPVMGDPTGRPERVAAGSTPANPGLLGIGASQAGGLRTNDWFPLNMFAPGPNPQPDRLPMLLWEGELIGRNAWHRLRSGKAFFTTGSWLDPPCFLETSKRDPAYRPAISRCDECRRQSVARTRRPASGIDRAIQRLVLLSGP